MQFSLRLMAWAGMAVLSAGAAGQTSPRIYVNRNATGTTSGLSWTNAAREIDDGVARAAALGYTEVWVAAGTYGRPVSMRDGVAVYGGFAGNETLLSQRDPAARPTILDVSRAAAGAPAPHAVTIVDIGDLALDGLVIRGGRADEPGAVSGGGIYCIGQNEWPIRIARCTVIDNAAADDGGGIYLAAANPIVIEDCSITSNSAARGGGLYVGPDAAPWIRRCRIRDNRALTGGGAAVYGSGTSLNECELADNRADHGGGVAGGALEVTLRNSRIVNNSATAEGGGAALSGEMIFRDCTLAGNQALRGAGIDGAPGAGIVAEGCTLAGNSAQARGGALYYEGQHGLDSGWLTGCTISGNRAPEGGGLALAAALSLRACVLSGNAAANGGALSWSAPGLDVAGCTLSDNSAVNGGAAYAPAGLEAQFVNSIFTGNTGYAFQTSDMAGCAVMLRHCLFQGNTPGDVRSAGQILTGARQLNGAMPRHYGNVDGSPVFLAGLAGRWSAPPLLDAAGGRTILTDAAASFTTGALAGRLVALGAGRAAQALVLENTQHTLTVQNDWRGEGQPGAEYRLLDYHLGSGSAALDRGRTSGLGESDLDLEPRPGSDGWGDMGADEAAAGLSVPPLLDDVAPASRVEPLPPLVRVPLVQLSVSAIDDGGGLVNVRVFYRHNQTTWTQTAEWSLNAGGTVPFTFNTRSAKGDGFYEFFSIATDGSGNSEAVPAVADAVTTVALPFPDRCVYVDAAAAGVLSGETWRDAVRTIQEGIEVAHMAGLSEIRVAAGAYPENLLIPDKIAIWGGFHDEGNVVTRDPLATPTVIMGVPVSADPAWQPSVVTMDRLTSAVLDGLMITGGNNSVGGGMLIRGGTRDTILSNCVITGNMARYGAGLLIDDGASPTLNGCRIINNTAVQEGGGLAVDTDSAPLLINCIVAGNTAGTRGAGMYVAVRSAPEIINCTFSGNSATVGNGGAIAFTGLTGALKPYIANSIFHGHRGSALAELDAVSDPVVRRCLFDANPGGDYLDEGATVLRGAAAVNASQTAPGGGNLEGAAVLGTDYRPLSGSAAIDRIDGSEAPGVDIDDGARPYDVPGQGNDGAAGTFDIGASEAQPRLALEGVDADGIVDFGTTDLGGESAPKTIRLVNQGAVTINFTGSGLRITGTGAGDFVAINGLTTTPLAAGASRVLTLVHRPTASGLVRPRLTVTTNDPNNPTLRVTLWGTGVARTPWIKVQPAAQLIMPGGTAHFSVVALGSVPMTYRWRKDGVTLQNGGRISGANSSALTIAGAQLMDQGLYRCTVSNVWGTTDSAAASLTVDGLLLNIGPDLGNPVPSAGNHLISSGTLVSARVTSTTLPDAQGTMRQVCAGWRGAGSISGSGTATAIAFTMNRPTTVTWVWKRQFFMDVAPDPVLWGTVGQTGGGPSTGWVDEGSYITLQAVGRAGFHFVRWQGGLNGTTNPIRFQVTGPLRATAVFEANTSEGSITIDGGAVATNKTTVMLLLLPPPTPAGPSKMRLRNEYESWKAWTDYIPTMSWQLLAGEGAKRVYVQYQDNDGVLSDVYTAMINLDTTPPKITGIQITPGLAGLGIPVHISFNLSEAAAPILMVNGHPAELQSQAGLAYTYQYAITGADPDGSAEVTAQASDNAGNLGQAFAPGQLVVEKTVPQTRITTPSQWSNQRVLLLAWTAVDPGPGASGMKEVKIYYRWYRGPFKLYGGFDPSLGMAAIDTAQLEGDGSYCFYTVGIDAAGNVEEAPAVPDCTIGVNPDAVAPQSWQQYR